MYSHPWHPQDETRGAFTGCAWLMGNLLALPTLRGRIQVNLDAELKVGVGACFCHFLVLNLGGGGTALGVGRIV